MVSSERTGWDYVAGLLQDEIGRLPQTVPQTVSAIRASVPNYSVVDPGEHKERVLQEFCTALTGWAQRRAPAAIELELAQNLGARRAAQGLAIEDVVASYHIGYHEIWSVLHERSTCDGTAQSVALLQLVGVMWRWVERTTSAVAVGHAAAMQLEQIQRLDTGRRFLDAIYAGQPWLDTIALLARSLGFDPTGTFGAACIETSSSPEVQLDSLRRAGRRLGAVAHAETRGARTILIAQGVAPFAIVKDAGLETTAGGISLLRKGLDGLELAIRDAEQAMSLAAHRGSGVIHFDAEWLGSILFSQRLGLSSFLSVEEDQCPRHLTEAVLAYATNGFSITAAGQVLHVRPNTIKYRLERWRQLTGWDPRTFDGLLKSMCAVNLAPWRVLQDGCG